MLPYFHHLAVYMHTVKPDVQLEPGIYRACAEKEGKRELGNNEETQTALGQPETRVAHNPRSTPIERGVGGCELRASPQVRTVQ